MQPMTAAVKRNVMATKVFVLRGFNRLSPTGINAISSLALYASISHPHEFFTQSKSTSVDLPFAIARGACFVHLRSLQTRWRRGGVLVSIIKYINAVNTGITGYYESNGVRGVALMLPLASRAAWTAGEGGNVLLIATPSRKLEEMPRPSNEHNGVKTCVELQ